MTLSSLHSLIPFRKLLGLLAAFSISLQIAVISYNQISGFYTIAGPADFFNRLIMGSVLSLAGAFLVAYPDLFLTDKLNQILPWDRRPVRRIVIQLLVVILLAITASTLITTISHLLGPYEQGLMPILITNGLIFTVCNILIAAILEGWIYFVEGEQSRQRTKNLEQELSQIRFEVLKNQINPHFMFNSLNVLSGLIDKDTEKAQDFIDEFSQVYRYVLESIEKPVVSLRDELDFAHSYMFLQKIRYGKGLEYRVEVSSDKLDYYLPPLSLQVVLENATKHNKAGSQKPLEITIRCEDDHLIISNNLQLKISQQQSTGLGQQNLVKRYELICSSKPGFYMMEDYYKVTLPLITSL